MIIGLKTDGLVFFPSFWRLFSFILTEILLEAIHSPEAWRKLRADESCCWAGNGLAVNVDIISIDIPHVNNQLFFFTFFINYKYGHKKEKDWNLINSWDSWGGGGGKFKRKEIEKGILYRESIEIC